MKWLFLYDLHSNQISIILSIFGMLLKKEIGLMIYIFANLLSHVSVEMINSNKFYNI